MTDNEIEAPPELGAKEAVEKLRFLAELDRREEAERSVAKTFSEVAGGGLASLRRTAQLLRRHAAEEEGEPWQWLPEEPFAALHLALDFRKMPLEFPWQRDVVAGEILRAGAGRSLDLAGPACRDVLLCDAETRAILAEAAFEWLRRNTPLAPGTRLSVSDAAVYAVAFANNVLALGEEKRVQAPGVENEREALLDAVLASLPLPADGPARGEALDYVVVHLVRTLLTSEAVKRPARLGGRPGAPAPEAGSKWPQVAKLCLLAAIGSAVFSLLAEDVFWLVLAGLLSGAAVISQRVARSRSAPLAGSVPEGGTASAPEPRRLRWLRASTDSRAVEAIKLLKARDIVSSPEILLRRIAKPGDAAARDDYGAQAEHLARLLDGSSGEHLVEWLLLRVVRSAGGEGAPNPQRVAEVSGLLETLLRRTSSTQAWAIVARMTLRLCAGCEERRGKKPGAEDWLALVHQKPGWLAGEVDFSCVRLVALLESYASVIECSYRAWDEASAEFLRMAIKLVRWVREQGEMSDLGRATLQACYVAEIAAGEAGTMRREALSGSVEPLTQLLAHLQEIERELAEGWAPNQTVIAAEFRKRREQLRGQDRPNGGEAPPKEAEETDPFPVALPAGLARFGKTSAAIALLLGRKSAPLDFTPSATPSHPEPPRASPKGERPAPAPRVKPETRPEQKSPLILKSGYELRWLPAGTFAMGSQPTEIERHGDEGPVTQVRLSSGFWLGRTTVTRGFWRNVMGGSSSEGVAGLPMTNVSWEEACAFCAALNTMAGALGENVPGFRYTLPTEAQWEYACRAGSLVAPAAAELDAIAWFAANSGKNVHAAGEKKPNAWGLHDMYGNVWEWCLDVYVNRLRGGEQTDPVETGSGQERVFRGGSFVDGASRLRPAYRDWGMKSERSQNLGFRVALTRDPAAPPVEAPAPAKLTAPQPRRKGRGKTAPRGAK